MRDFPNMEYTMMTNTNAALRQVIKAIDDAREGGEELDLRAEEARAKAQLVRACKTFLKLVEVEDEGVLIDEM